MPFDPARQQMRRIKDATKIRKVVILRQEKLPDFRSLSTRLTATISFDDLIEIADTMIRTMTHS